MANLLPSKELAELMAERRRRLRAAILVLVSGMCAFGIVLLIPSVIALMAARASGAERLAATRELAARQKHAGAGAQIAAMKEQTEILSSYESSTAPHELVERLTGSLPSGITLHSISFTRQGNEETMELSGAATSRAALLSFGDALKGSGRFTDVVIPIESLAQATDLQFHLVLTLLDPAP
jgi:Tfp pilus assembly protein PilN